MIGTLELLNARTNSVCPCNVGTAALRVDVEIEFGLPGGRAFFRTGM